MSYKNPTESPDDLFEKVEQKLSAHLKKKRRFKNNCKILVTFLLLISFLNYRYLIGFASELIDGMDRGIMEAIENNEATKINKKFTVNNITFDFNSIVADETGIAILFHVNDKEGYYDIRDYSVIDENGKDITEFADIKTSKISSDANVLYMSCIKGNSFTLNINGITKVLFNEKGEYIPVEYKTDWKLPLKYKVNKVKSIKVNKEFPIDNGRLIVENVKLGVLRSKLLYKVIQDSGDKKDSITPDFIIKSGNKHYKTLVNYENDNEGCRVVDFESIIHDDISNLEIMLGSIRYQKRLEKEIAVKKSDIPKELEILGDKFKIAKYETYTAKTEKLPQFMRKSIEEMPELEPYIKKRTDLYIDISNKNRHYDKYYVLIYNKSRSEMSEVEENAYIYGGYNFYEVFNKVDHYNQTEMNEALNRINAFSNTKANEADYEAQTRMFTSTCGNYDDVILKFEIAEVTKYYGQKITVSID